MSRTYRRAGSSWHWGRIIINACGLVEWVQPKPKVKNVRDGKAYGPPSSMKRIWNRMDRRRWNWEATKQEPQLPRNHRHWGTWDWW